MDFLSFSCGAGLADNLAMMFVEARDEAGPQNRCLVVAVVSPPWSNIRKVLFNIDGDEVLSPDTDETGIVT
jgi:hypothetical protein